MFAKLKQLFSEPKTARSSAFEVKVQNPRNIYGLYTSEFSGLTSDQIKFYLEAARKGVNFFKGLLFEEIRNRDLRIGGICQTRKLAPASKQWKIESDNEERRQFIADVLAQLDMQNIITSIVEAQIQGVTLFEINWQAIGNKIIPIELRRIPNWLLCYDDIADEYKVLDASTADLFQMKINSAITDDRIDLSRFSLVDIDPNKLLEAEASDNINPNGFRNGCIDGLIWIYFLKNYGLKDYAAYLELFGNPMRIGKYDPLNSNPATEQKLINAVRDFGNLSWAVLSNDMSIEFPIEPGKASDSVINHFLKLYYRLGQPNCMFAVKRLQEIASKTEELYEIAAVPRMTLYKYCLQYLKDNNLLQSWNYANRRGKFQQLPINGAFTDDIEFMDYYAMDDRKADISGVLVWDDVKKEWKTKTVFYWIIIEMKTMMPIGWVIKPDALNSQDVIAALNQAFMTYGLPKKGILFDNGIGYSAQVQSYITRLKQLYAGSGYFTSPFKPGPAYTPTYKANIERFNKLLKDEFDLNFRNYVGGNRNEVRHTSLRLTPEQAEHTISEYVRMAESYLTGDCINRKRHRVINGKKLNISISDLFEKLSQNFEFCKVAPKDLAWAALEYDKPRLFRGTIRITYKGTVINYLPDNVPYELIGKKVYVAYNQQDLSRIWLYSAEHVGRIKRGDFISEAKAMNLVADKQAEIFRINAELRKTAKAHKEAILNYAAASNDKINEALNSIVSEDGKAINKRKQLLRKLQSAEPGTERRIIESTINNEPELTPAEVEGGYSLTYNQEEVI